MQCILWRCQEKVLTANRGNANRHTDGEADLWNNMQTRRQRKASKIRKDRNAAKKKKKKKGEKRQEKKKGVGVGREE